MRSNGLWFVSGFLCCAILVASLWLDHWHENDSEWASHGAASRQNDGVTFVIGHRDKLRHGGEDTPWEVMEGRQFQHGGVQTVVVVNIKDKDHARELQDKIRKVIAER